MLSLIDKILGEDMHRFANHLETHESDGHTHHYSTRKIKAGMERLKEYIRKLRTDFDYKINFSTYRAFW